MPQPDPPKLEIEADIGRNIAPPRDTGSPTVEWIYHKTEDGTHPDGNEQQFVWLMNRARCDPTAEGQWLATVDDTNIAMARNYFNVDLAVLQSEFAAILAKPPAAFDVRLYYAAMVHSEDLIARDAQDHNNQFDRVTEAGFKFLAARGNVFSYAESAVYGHAGFNIDWGYGDDGMQDGRGHRKAIMATDGDYTNVGIAAIAETDSSTSVGPLVVTGNYCKANTGYENHYNRFLVGTVWEDQDGDSLFDPGEGLGGVTVMPDHGPYYAVTADSGGFALPIISAGDYQVTFSGASLAGEVVKNTTIQDDSVLLDVVVGEGGQPVAATEAATNVTSSSATLNGTVDPNGQTTTYYFQYGQSIDYSDSTANIATDTTCSVSNSITGLSANTTYYFRLVATNSEGTSLGSPQSFTTEAATDRELVEAFVTRFYQQCLDREPDAAGLEDWVEDLLAGARAGSDVAQGFIFSQEFINRDTSDAEFVSTLYQAFFNRQPDQNGYIYWLGQLSSGAGRADVLSGFINAAEFYNLCEAYGIEAVSARPQVEAFVTRFYQQCLQREPDTEGLNYWVDSLMAGSLTGTDVAQGFIYSAEFVNRNTSDAQYVTILYQAFFNREKDAEGYNYWCSQLAQGAGREQVLDGFIYAQEFANLCTQFEILPY